MEVKILSVTSTKYNFSYFFINIIKILLYPYDILINPAQEFWKVRKHIKEYCGCNKVERTQSNTDFSLIQVFIQSVRFLLNEMNVISLLW